jgi:thioredoxin 1
MSNVLEFTEKNWEEQVVQSDIPVLVDFWAVWCGPCRALAPTIDQLAEQYSGKVKVGKLNTDDNPNIAVKYGINTIPQVLLFRGGDQPLDRQVGNAPIDRFTQMVDRALGS